MFSYFPKVGAKGKDVQGLLKNSITLLGKDIDVFKPAIYMTLTKSVQTMTTFFMFYCFFISKETEKGALSMLAIFLMAPIISYINMRYKAITNWMVYDILREKDTDMSKGSNELKGLSFTLFLYSIVDYIMKSNFHINNNKEGVIGIIKELIFTAFQEVWDLVKNFSLPSIVIEKVSLTQLPAKLKLVKNNIPASLVGILGIDIVGSVFISLFSFIQIPSILIGISLGHYGQSFFPQSWIVTLPFNEPFSINLLPLFIVLLASSIFFSFLNSLVQLVKTSYFTTFYISLSRPNEISESLRDDVANYLNFNNRLEGYTFFEQKVPKDEEGHEFDEETGEDLKLIRKVSNTFSKNVAKGISEKRIYSALLKKGYTKEQLSAGLKHYRSKEVA